MADGEWKIINNFKPGIHHTVSATHPLGTAQEANTWGCRATDDGSLIPLPKLTSVIESEELTSDTLLSEEYRITGLFCNDPVFFVDEPATGIHQNNSEVYVAFEWYDNGGTAGADQQVKQVQRFKRNYAITPEWDVIYTRAVDLDYDPLTRPKKCEFVSMRSNSADADMAGPVVVAFVYNEIAQMFPDDTATTVNGTAFMPGDNVDDVANTGGLLSVDGLVSHQGRAVIFPLTVLGMGADQLYTTNEAFYWTLVNDLTTRDDTITGGGFLKAIASYDNPTGFQVYQSLTADELLMIKARGGAIMVSGNLNDYQVRNLPNVRGTGHSMNRGTPSPRGFVYPIDNGGVWLWEGGDLSVNIAPHLNANFWRPPAVSPATGAHPSREQDDNGWGYAQTQCCEWNQLVMLPNNWVWDTDHNGFWKIAADGQYVIHRWASDWAGLICYGAPSGFLEGIAGMEPDPVIYEFNKVVPATEFSWRSQPLEGTLERQVEIREVIVTASGNGTVTVILDGPGGELQQEELTILPTLTPHTQAITFGAVDSHISMRLLSEAATEDDAAPTIHSVKYLVVDGTQHTRASGV